MVGNSRSSLRDSMRPSRQEKPHARRSVSSINNRNNRTRQLRGDGEDSDRDNSSDQFHHLLTTATTTTTTPGGETDRKSRTTTTITAKTKTTLTTSKSLPNLVVRTTKNTPSTSNKRPRLSSPSLSSSSTSSPPPPPPPHPPPRSSPRRPQQQHHRRAPLASRHLSSSQQTTLDKFLGNHALKDNNKSNNNGNFHTETETERPAKKVRLGRDRTHESSTALQNRESPDPLNVISPPSSSEQVRMRRRGNTLTTSSPRSTDTIPTSPILLNRSTTTRSTRNKVQNPLIIADDATGKTENGEQSLNGQGQKQRQQHQQQSLNASSQAPEKRSLRSHDGGSRSKSELALYFPNYEQIISLEPVKAEFLDFDTTVTVLNDLTESVLPLTPVESASPSRTRKQRKSIDQISPFGNPLIDLYAVEKIELPSIDVDDDDSNNVITDPLNDDVYFKAHRRHERQEKQLRNIEKERAQHEKIQLDRLLDELQGHDWLRVMGISGITDTEKKLYEPKRDYFVKEVSALIEKFRVWKEEEKRRKLEREQTLLEAAAALTATEGENEEAEAEEDEDEEEDEEEEDSGLAKPPSSDIQSYDSSEVDAAAAQQLIQEARSASVNANGATIMLSPSTPPHSQPRRRLVDELSGTPPNKIRSARRNSKAASAIQALSLSSTTAVEHISHQLADDAENDSNKPFTSFYSKRHLRDAAFSSSRRHGRNRSAFGQPLPEMEEKEFELPSDILTEDIMHAMERKRRRLKRESKG